MVACVAWRMNFVLHYDIFVEGESMVAFVRGRSKEATGTSRWCFLNCQEGGVWSH